jgi:hypothetical protein
LREVFSDNERKIQETRKILRSCITDRETKAEIEFLKKRWGYLTDENSLKAREILSTLTNIAYPSECRASCWE